MVYSDLTDLLPDLFDCLEASGFTTESNGTIDYYPGFPIPDYGSVPPQNLTQEQQNDITSECSNKTYDWAQVFYVSQGSAMDAYEKSFSDQRTTILACLRERGVEVDDNVPIDELIYVVTEDANTSGQDACYTGDVFIGYARP